MAGFPAKVYQWQAAFVAFVGGAPTDEISQVFEIPAETLKRRMELENWAKLRDSVMVQVASQVNTNLPERVEAKLKLIEDNRKANLEIFAKLREHLLEEVNALRDGRLKLEKHWNFKGMVVTKEVNPGPGDWVNIATYARTIAEGTYRALGDFAAQEKPGSDAPAGAGAPQPPAITIILPGAIAQPREQRAVTDAKAGQVIDLRPLAEEPAAPASHASASPDEAEPQQH